MGNRGLHKWSNIKEGRKENKIFRPSDIIHEYFFFRFAIELNEILESERTHLPKTDTRFRPDQRALEVSWQIYNADIIHG